MPSAVSTEVLLELKGVTIQYADDRHLVTAVQNVGFKVHCADRFVLLGPSGCGKSTLLKAVAGFLRPAAGDILLAGVPVTQPGPDRIMVFQEFDQLLPWKTVRANIVFPMRENGIGRREAAARADRHLDRVGLTKFAEHFPHQLSGGMKQRAAIARALALEPRVLLMDEPFAALDALTRRRMQEQLLELWNEFGFTLLFVTHSIDEAVLVGTRILLLSPHPGRVQGELDVPPLAAGQADEKHHALARRIHRLLFEEERPGETEALAHG